jgi:hypothetical protein
MMAISVLVGVQGKWSMSTSSSDRLTFRLGGLSLVVSHVPNNHTLSQTKYK